MSLLRQLPGIHSRLVVLLIVLTLTGSPWMKPAEARALGFGGELCHAVTADETPPPRYQCAGEPEGYQDRHLWLRVDPALLPRDAGGGPLTLLIHQTRFERVEVLFRYADHQILRQEAKLGDFASRWRIGGQLLFSAPARPAPLVSVTIHFTHLSSHKLLRIRLFASPAANRDLAIAALLVGASLTLLLAGGIYNLALAVAARRTYLVWHGLWALCVFLWGLVWSQAALIVVPGIAGTVSSQIGTFLACLAVAIATISVMTALAGALSRRVRIGVIGLGVLVAMLGVPLAILTGPAIMPLANVLAFLTLANLIAVAACMTRAWRRGSIEARDLSKAWAIPMAVLALTMIVDLDTQLFGGGSQIAVLFASAFQSMWLALAATRRLARLRTELDAARAAEVALAELANRDPLTGLFNRRGFVARLYHLCAAAPATPLGLLLIDVDLFKSINDRFGHEAGDTVLRTMASYFRGLEAEGNFTGRMGGEEFIIAAPGLSAFALEQFAERVRAAIEALDHGEVSRHRPVTASIGVARGTTATPFQQLYASADRALYEAKHAGRNRVIFPASDNEASREMMERDQLAFPWSGT
ncbi:diguanylate cyclase domain-containing protein [Sphingomonas sp.]|uniref:GGDEF domain-containing protein n=1 Tax=Sphingomonas sp. TaxID=28214 RepID=UPI003B3AD150